jgi:hydroxyacyl-ACP dehydratase HTD2-like protein with hotdog domain
MSSSNAQRIGCCSAASSTSRIQASRGTVLCFSINGRRAIASKAVEVAEQINSRSLNNVIIRRQVLDGNQLQKLSLTLNRRLLHPHLDVSNSPPPNGTPIPPGYHLVYFTPEGVEADLGVDGTDLTFNAPKPFTRRMWAGGELRWTKDCELKTGNVGEERTRLLKATPKRSRDGSEMVLVDVVKEFWANDKLCLVDQR